MDISVIICTYNRCESLKDTLDSLLNQESDGNFDYEVIIVDNNSKDRTKKLIEDYKNKFNGRLRYLFELRQGKPYALNLGINESKGKILSFTDDDIILNKNWFIEINKTFQNQQIDIVGGKILPIWLSKKPQWYDDELYGVIGIQNYGDTFYITTLRNKLPFGANQSFRKELFNKYGLFDEKMIYSQDAEICSRFLNKGSRLAYNPNLLVFHKVEPCRLTRKYFCKWQYRRGKMSAFMKEPEMINILTGLFDKLTSFFWCFLKMDQRSRITHEIRFFFYIGLLKGKMNCRFGKKINTSGK